MTHAIAPTDTYHVRGWCPTARRPMATGDGLIVRLGLRGRSLRPADLSSIAALAEQHGNGLIDLTRRANVQLRGVEESSLPRLWRELARIGMLEDAQASSRSILIGPVAGVDSSEIADPRPLAEDLATAVAADPALLSLPAKFSFAIDGGGRLPLDAEAADVRLRAVIIGGRAMLAVGVDGPHGIRWLGSCALSAGGATAARLAKTFLDHRASGQSHMRELSDAVLARLLPLARLGTLPDGVLPQRRAARPLGVVRVAEGTIAVGLAAPFGRIAAPELHGLSEAAARLGIAEMRVSPWRSLYAVTKNTGAATALIAAATELGFITNEDEPLLAIDACPGAPACRSASVDTRAAALRLAPRLKELGVGSCHISGCSKGCARSAAADVTLVGADGAFAVIRNGTARGAPRGVVAADDLAALSQHLKPV